MKEQNTTTNEDYKALMLKKLGISEDALQSKTTTSELSPKAKVKRIVDDIMDGLRSSMSYTGSDTIDKFQHKAIFNRVSQAGLNEAQPHGLGRNCL